MTVVRQRRCKHGPWCLLPFSHSLLALTLALALALALVSVPAPHSFVVRKAAGALKEEMPPPAAAEPEGAPLQAVSVHCRESLRKWPHSPSSEGRPADAPQGPARLRHPAGSRGPCCPRECPRDPRSENLPRTTPRTLPEFFDSRILPMMACFS